MQKRKKNNEENNEIRKYYLSVLTENEEEISSDISTKKFNIWEMIETYRKKFNINQRLVDIGGGVGDFAYTALRKGYNVIIIDKFDELIKKLEEKYPEFKKKTFIVDIFDVKGVSNLIDELDQFDIVTVLGSVPNHAVNKSQLKNGLYNILKFGDTNSLFIIDLLMAEMFPGNPLTIWSDFKHTLTSFHDIELCFRKYGLRLLDLYTIHESYPSPRGSKEFEEHSIRLFIHKPW